MLAVVLASCIKETNEAVSPIKFDFGIDQTTRAQDTSFELEDAVGLYNYSLTNDILYSNVLFANTAVGFKNFEPIYYHSPASVNFISYYPYSADMVWSPNALTNWSVSEYQWLERNYTDSDIMVAKAENVAEGTKQVNLNFSHLMSKIELNIIPGLGYTAEYIVNNIEIRVVNTKRSCKINFLSSAISELDNAGDIEPTKNYVITNGVVKGAQAIIVPQVIPAGNLLIEVAVGGVKYTYRPSADFTFYQGKKTVFNLTVSDNGVKSSSEMTFVVS